MGAEGNIWTLERKSNRIMKKIIYILVVYFTTLSQSLDYIAWKIG
jgi:hypothetical protein